MVSPGGSRDELVRLFYVTLSVLSLGYCLLADQVCEAGTQTCSNEVTVSFRH